MVVVVYILVGGWQGFEGLFSGNDKFIGQVSDCVGVGTIFAFGAGFLVLSGWALLLALFVVLEVTRGISRGSLRAVR